MKKVLKALIAICELSAEDLNNERDSKFAIENERYFDNFIFDIGALRMKAREILHNVKYEGDD